MDNNFFPILVAGMGHSGSTLLYNIILNILDSHGITGAARYNAPPYTQTFHILANEAPQYLLFKVHGKTPASEIILQNKNTKVFTTRRDIRDSVASHTRKIKKRGTFSGQTIEQRTKHALNPYLEWENRSDFEFVYEDYKNGNDEGRSSILLEIAKVLNLDLEEESIKKILYVVEEVLPARAQLLSNETDSDTLMTKYHITNKGLVGSYKDFLDSDEIEQIEQICGEWLKNKGYI